MIFIFLLTRPVTMHNRKLANIGDGVDVKRCETVVCCEYKSDTLS